MTDTFKAVTWNVFYGTERDELEPILAAQRKRGVSLFLIQEASKKFWPDLVRDAGLRFAFHKPQYLIAWDPEPWVGVAEEGVRLSETAYFRKDGKTPVWSDAATATLCDREGRSLLTASYHTPAHVQYRESERPARRYQSFVESMRKLGAMADDFEGTAVLFGGDDNWDEDTGLQTEHTKPVFLGEDTGLRQIAAPAGTHGKRQIDDFRIKRGGRLRPTKGSGWVADGGGDHKLHGREFRWR
jgi:hypothetical protein